ncbi:lactococcin 972 family bacteriocin [Lactococcus ileimucosae]|uniref:Lactococcin 972 family bacteriocin n=1 Tax=Lactococcus ileimucosae TaxID=2941329 RepID=A0ABV4D1W7_9LACT
MKKIVLLLAVLTLGTVTFEKLAIANLEQSSGGLTAEQLDERGNVQTRKVSNVGGGTWYYMVNVNGRTISEYNHRDRKHSATVSRTNGVFNKSVRPAGQTAKASLPYKSGANSVYWNNSPKEAVGNYNGAKF